MLFIIGIVTTMVVLSVGTADSGRLLQEEARRLAALVELSCEEAVLRGDTFALSFGPGGTAYGFLRRTGAEWLPRQAGQWRTRTLPEGFSAELRIEGRTVLLNQAGSGRPHLVCLASGELVPFEVSLSAPGTPSVWRVSGEWDGDVTIERVKRA